MLCIEWVTPICLPFGDSLNLNLTNQIGEVAGWGLTNSDDEVGTPFLQTVKVFMYNKRCVHLKRDMAYNFKFFFVEWRDDY